jgi:hypothetical protein
MTDSLLMEMNRPRMASEETWRPFQVDDIPVGTMKRGTTMSQITTGGG